MLFFPIQQDLDCINDAGVIVGRIRFDAELRKHVFVLTDESVELSSEEESRVSERLTGLDSGKYVIPMQDDD